VLLFGKLIIIGFLLISIIMQIDGDIMRTIKFVDSLKIPYIAPSFGGVESVVNQPAIMSYWY
jgi:cystathionine gamma-synthase